MRQHRLELGFRSETIRRANLSAIVRELHYGGPLSRSELGARTGLTRGAIRILTGELASAGLVHEESGAAVGTPGRPSAIVRLRSHSAAVLALEITVDSLAAAIIGLGGNVLRSERVDRPREAFSVEQMTAAIVGLGGSHRCSTRLARAHRRHRRRHRRDRAPRRGCGRHRTEPGLARGAVRADTR